MSYHFFGNFHGKPADEVLAEAKKQKKAEDVVSAVLHPLSFAARTGAKAVVGTAPHIVSDEQFTKALILKTLKEHNLAPQKRFERTVRQIVLNVLKEQGLIAEHPHWANGIYKKR